MRVISNILILIMFPLGIYCQHNKFRFDLHLVGDNIISKGSSRTLIYEDCLIQYDTSDISNALLISLIETKVINCNNIYNIGDWRESIILKKIEYYYNIFEGRSKSFDLLYGKSKRISNGMYWVESDIHYDIANADMYHCNYSFIIIVQYDKTNSLIRVLSKDCSEF